MFGFLKRRQLREHIKLTYQNAMAFGVFAEIEKEDETFEFNSDQQMQVLWERAREISAEFHRTGKLETELVLESLQLNKTARRIHDSMTAGRRNAAKVLGSKYRPESFDQAFKPMLGWGDAYERFKESGDED